MTVAALEEIWASLGTATPHLGTAGRRAPGLPLGRAAYLSVDGAGRRHLLIEVPEGTEPLSFRETKGLEVRTERLQVGDNSEALYIVLACSNAAQHQPFTALAEDVLAGVRNPEISVRNAASQTLTRWRSFWASTSGGLSAEEALGLFGELWFLHRWLGVSQLGDVKKWMATPRARHDFQWPAASVEVKTAAGGGAEGVVHPITHLDQLDDPEQGQLYLFSLHVIDDALSHNSLVSLVNTTSDALRNNAEATSLFEQKLTSYGFTPADAQNQHRPLRVVAERLYRVGPGFPRLTRRSFSGGLPPGIGKVSYTLTTAACQPWLIASSPQDSGASFFLPART